MKLAKNRPDSVIFAQYGESFASKTFTL